MNDSIAFTNITVESTDGEAKLPSPNVQGELIKNGQFVDSHMEVAFRKHRSRQVLQSSRLIVAATWIISLASIICEPILRSEDEFVTRLGFTIGTIVLMSILALHGYCIVFADTVMALVYTGAGICWALSTCVESDTLNLPVSATRLILWQVLGASFSHLFIFSLLCMSQWLTCIFYVAFALIWRLDAQPWEDTILEILYSVFATALVSTLEYHNAVSQRLYYRTRIRALKSRSDAPSHNTIRAESSARIDELENEIYEMRKKVFDLTMEKHNLTVQVDKIDWSSPEEQCRNILQKLLHHPGLRNDVFDQIRKAFVLLGKTHSYTDHIRTKIAAKRVDAETERWLLNLVSGGDEARLDHHYRRGSNAKMLSMSSFSSSQSQTMNLLDMKQTNFRRPSIQAHLQATELKSLNSILKKIDEWEFDVFEASRISKGSPLLFIGMALFHKYDLLTKFDISPAVLKQCLSAIEAGYQREVPYHNSIHAADVTRTMHFFLLRGGCADKLKATDEELLAAIIACCMHDFEHPGLNNNFHIAMKDEKAIIYNDKAVLENHHCCAFFRTVMKPENNIFANLTPEQERNVRRLIIDMVLMTDLSAHMTFVRAFRNFINVDQGEMDFETPENRNMVLQMAIKCADLGHAAKPLLLHQKWTERITEEFYRQGDLEKKEGVPVSPFMDRNNGNIAKSQIGFMKFLVMPMWEVWCEFLERKICSPPMPCMDNLRSNLQHWLDCQQMQEHPAIEEQDKEQEAGQ